jgi:hypothetical protein
MEISGELHAPATLIPPDRKLGYPESRFGHAGDEKSNSAPIRI